MAAGLGRDSYCVRGPWKWVFEEALVPQGVDCFASRRSLFGEAQRPRDRATTANFIFRSSLQERIVTGDSTVFDGLENKDLFCSTMKRYAPKTIPLSILLPYDCHLNPSYDFSFPSIPAVLKTCLLYTYPSPRD